VACGAGQISIPAARAGARVTGVDIATNSIEQARARAQDEGLDARFEEGDAEMLPYEDASFDLVVSLIGAMFAPRPERVAAELVRVCRPGGRIVMANWTPEGFVGQMFKIIGKHVPPPALMSSPLLWGDEATVRERLSDGVAELHVTKRQYPFYYPSSPRPR
jgi:ubiquinone/menaquinone biosynthesis C-methylase UbiE